MAGVVLDVGFSEATLIPIYEGVPILKAWQAQPLASKAVHQSLRELISHRGTVRTKGSDKERKIVEVEGLQVSDDIIEDIKGERLY